MSEASRLSPFSGTGSAVGRPDTSAPPPTISSWCSGTETWSPAALTTRGARRRPTSSRRRSRACGGATSRGAQRDMLEGRLLDVCARCQGVKSGPTSGSPSKDLDRRGVARLLRPLERGAPHRVPVSIPRHPAGSPRYVAPSGGAPRPPALAHCLVDHEEQDPRRGHATPTASGRFGRRRFTAAARLPRASPPA